MSNLIISQNAIRQIDNLYSLNDLHKASGNAEKHRPSLFIRLDTTQDIISEIQKEVKSTDLIFKTTGGRGLRGTYACEELVIAYAMWISPKFHLIVLRAFLNLHKNQTALLASTINPEQQQAIQEAVVKAHHRTGMSYAEIYRQLKSLFKVGKYDQLKPSQFEGAINFLTTLGNSYAPIDRMDNLELTEQEWLDWQNFYYAVTRFSESVEILMSVLRPFRSHQQSSVEFNLDVVQRYIRTTNPAVRKINDRINCTNRRPLAIGHYNESATSVAVFK